MPTLFPFKNYTTQYDSATAMERRAVIRSSDVSYYSSFKCCLSDSGRYSNKL